jgi:hypothetical protein
MYKKFLFPLILTLVAILATGGVAYAADASAAGYAPATAGRPESGIIDPGAVENLNRGLGQITAIGDNQFTLQLKNRGEKVIQVNENTRYFKADGSVGSFADLQVGLWVAGRVSNSGGNLTARVVILLPAGYDPTRKNAAARGEVTAKGDNRFNLHTPRGEDVTILVDGNTTYLGEIHSFSDLQVGMKVVVGAQKLEDGSLLAIAVAVRANLIRHAGSITTVDPAGSSFGLGTRQGERLTFQVDGSTQYFGQVKSLADLHSGMLAVVAAKQLDNGSYLAERVTAHEKPQVDVKAAGKVTAIDTASFTITSRKGESITFQVTPETRFRSRGGQVKSLKDLRLGMGVGVAAQETDGGQLLALVVVAKVK